MGDSGRGVRTAKKNTSFILAIILMTYVLRF